jgi:hypothetical protein
MQNKAKIIMSNKIESLYNQCFEAYEKYRNNDSIVTYDEHVMPSPLDDEYNVPAESLFNELPNSQKNWHMDSQEFNLKLMEWVSKRKKWNLDEFLEKGNGTGKNNSKKYEIYLEIFYRCDNYRLRPFNKSIKIDNTIISWCSKKEFLNICNEYMHFGKIKNNKSIWVNDKINDEILMTTLRRNFPKLKKELEKNIHNIKITIWAKNSESAIDIALEKLDILMECLNISQNIQKYYACMIKLRDNIVKSRRIFVSTGRFIVVSGQEYEVYHSSKGIKDLPSTSYSDKKFRKVIFKRIIYGITNKSFLQGRLRNVVRDLNIAYCSDDIGVKYLGFWRCLEHATRYSEQNRKEKEIIDIFKYQYKNKFWKQMGDLILKARNKYVHVGTHVVKDSSIDKYIIWFQKYAEESLIILLGLHKKIKYWDNEEKLKAYFDNCIKSDEYLEAVSNIYKKRRKRMVENNSVFS